MGGSSAPELGAEANRLGVIRCAQARFSRHVVLVVFDVATASLFRRTAPRSIKIMKLGKATNRHLDFYLGIPLLNSFASVR